MDIELRPAAGEKELSDPAVTGQFASEMAALAAQEQVPPWCGYIAWRGEAPVGFAGFTAAPGADGVVELGYLTFPQHEDTGVATAGAAGLVEIAAAGPECGHRPYALPAQCFDPRAREMRLCP